MDNNPAISPTIQKTLFYAVANKASDIHLKTGQSPAIRINGAIVGTELPVLTADEIGDFVGYMCPIEKENMNPLEACDFSWVYEGERFRCNVFNDNNGPCVSMRYLYLPTTDFSVLGIPEVLKKLADKKSGLILITGPTGSGKTTTLTCLIDHINKNYPLHIVMLEDPIEFIHKSNRSLISQREIGVNARSYNSAIVEALREDPDIILIGEMRDKDSIQGALRAAETGHLVLSTLHTKGTANSISRIIDIFPPEEQTNICMQLSMSLLGIVSQQLIPKADNTGRVLATEIMIANLPIQNLIRQQKLHMINSTLDLSSSDGMHTMKRSLEDLLMADVITRESYDNYQIC